MIINLMDAEAKIGIPMARIDVAIFNYKAMYSKLPDWYVNKGKEQRFINVDKMMEKTRLEKECWDVATDPDGLYWGVRLYLIDLQFAKKLAARSHRFKSEMSWLQFLSRTMWRVQDEKVIKICGRNTPPMQVDFIRHSMDILHGLVSIHGKRCWDDEHKIIKRRFTARRDEPKMISHAYEYDFDEALEIMIEQGRAA